MSEAYTVLDWLSLSPVGSVKTTWLPDGAAAAELTPSTTTNAAAAIKKTFNPRPRTSAHSSRFEQQNLSFLPDWDLSVTTADSGQLSLDARRRNGIRRLPAGRAGRARRDEHRLPRAASPPRAHRCPEAPHAGAEPGRVVSGAVHAGITPSSFTRPPERHPYLRSWRRRRRL